MQALMVERFENGFYYARLNAEEEYELWADVLQASDESCLLEKLVGWYPWAEVHRVTIEGEELIYFVEKEFSDDG